MVFWPHCGWIADGPKPSLCCIDSKSDIGKLTIAVARPLGLKTLHESFCLKAKEGKYPHYCAMEELIYFNIA